MFSFELCEDSSLSATLRAGLFRSGLKACCAQNDKKEFGITFCVFD